MTRTKFLLLRVAVLTVTVAGVAAAQTQVDLRTQSKSIDFTGASSTKPFSTGPTLPATCAVGQMFFVTSASSGQNTYGCSAVNTWSLQSGGTTSSGGGGLTEFMATNTSSNVQAIGAACNSTNPCVLRMGSVVVAMTTPASATITGSVTNGTVYWYLSSTQVLTAGYAAAATLTCSGCSAVSGVSSFPPDSIPLWQTSFTLNIWDAINLGTMDKRAFLSNTVIASGSGIASASNPITGVQTLSTDPTVVPRYYAAAGVPSSSCTAGRDFYTDTTGLNLYFCDAVNSWKQGNGSGTGGSGGGSSGSATVTDSSYHWYPSAASAANVAGGTNFINNGWITDSTSALYIAGALPNPLNGIHIPRATGVHYAYLMVSVPVGWTSTIGLVAYSALYYNNSGTGSGADDFALSCYIPGTTNPQSSVTWTSTVSASFTEATPFIGHIDTPALTPPPCSPGTVASPTGAMLMIRMVREDAGTAVDDTVLVGFQVSLPHTVQ